MGQCLSLDGLLSNFEVCIAAFSPTIVLYFLLCLPAEDSHPDFSNVLRGIGISLNAVLIMGVDYVLSQFH